MKKVDLANPDDIACEEHFKIMHYRLPSRWYVVHLPFKANQTQCPSTLRMAIKRLNNIEHRLFRNSE